jgi:hypothetical protein
MRRYHGIHKHQLFYWLASKLDREAGLRGQLRPAARREYIEYLRGSLENGIWLKSPRDPETITFRGVSQPLDKAMACFTEWSLNESRPHTTEYGRMGLGFSKAWMIDHGGQPVTYFNHSAKSPFLKTLVSLLIRLKSDPKALEELLYVIHFTKRIHKSSGKPKAGAAAILPATRILRHRKKRTLSRVPDAYARFWSTTMPYLEEREWRIVEHPALVKRKLLIPNRSIGDPKYYLPFEAGKDLFTVVLPDNRTVSEVLNEKWFTDRLFPKNGPHVTALSLQDIGTF